MNSKIKSILLCALLFTSSQIIAQGTAKQKHTKSEHVMVNENNLQWKDGPASLPKGAQIAVIEGDPSKEGPFTMRLKLPANYQIKPHYHPAIEHLTVIKGSIYMELGEKFDMNKATKLEKNGFAVMPMEVAHYAFTKEEAQIQLHGIGPWDIIYINKADDPRESLRTGK